MSRIKVSSRGNTSSKEAAAYTFPGTRRRVMAAVDCFNTDSVLFSSRSASSRDGKPAIILGLILIDFKGRPGTKSAMRQGGHSNRLSLGNDEGTRSSIG